VLPPKTSRVVEGKPSKPGTSHPSNQIRSRQARTSSSFQKLQSVTRSLSLHRARARDWTLPCVRNRERAMPAPAGPLRLSSGLWRSSRSPHQRPAVRAPRIGRHECAAVVLHARSMTHLPGQKASFSSVSMFHASAQCA
jgi:hypothetical protein